MDVYSTHVSVDIFAGRYTACASTCMLPSPFSSMTKCFNLAREQWQLCASKEVEYLEDFFFFGGGGCQVHHLNGNCKDTVVLIIVGPAVERARLHVCSLPLNQWASTDNLWPKRARSTLYLYIHIQVYIYIYTYTYMSTHEVVSSG